MQSAAQADTVFEMTPATPENREAICKAVESITHQSGTNLSGGLLSAVSQLASNVVSTTASSVKSVFLFTDGEPTHGFLKQATLMPVLEDALKISSTFGANLKVRVSYALVSSILPCSRLVHAAPVAWMPSAVPAGHSS